MSWTYIHCSIYKGKQNEKPSGFNFLSETVINCSVANQTGTVNIIQTEVFRNYYLRQFMKSYDWKDYEYRCHYLKAGYLYRALVAEISLLSVYQTLDLTIIFCHLLLKKNSFCGSRFSGFLQSVISFKR